VDALAADHAASVERLSPNAVTRCGLYAIHAGAEVWRELGLGAPDDKRPLYVGKAESSSLATRDISTHFGYARRRQTSVTGRSTVRRSLAALLHDTVGFRGIPRNPASPGYFPNYGLTPEQDDALSSWMRTRLRLAVWPKPDDCPLDLLETIEKKVFGRLLPPLNLRRVVTQWKPQIEAARRVLAAEARSWSATRRAPDARSAHRAQVKEINLRPSSR
jgi:hypothetical protein